MTDAPAGVAVFGLISVVSLYLLTATPLRRKFTRLSFKKKSAIIAVITASVLLALTMVLWCFEKYYYTYHQSIYAQFPGSPDLSTRPKFNWWIQVLLGKWLPASAPYPPRSFAWSLSVISALVLTFGPLAATITVMWTRLLRPILDYLEMEEIMTTMTNEQVIHFLHADIIAEINRLDPKEREGMPAIRECFARGEQNWLDKLPQILGRKRAKRIAAAMKATTLDHG